MRYRPLGMTGQAVSCLTLSFGIRDITAGPVARVKMPRRVPFGFHGNWMPGVV